MKRLPIIIILLAIVLLAFGCSKNDKASFEIADIEQSMVSEPSEEQTTDIERKLIKEGSVEFETFDVNFTRKQIFASIEKYKAYISMDQEYKSVGRISNSIVIRVPANSFDLLLNDVTKGVTQFDHKNINVKDVTEEFLDVQARLKTKKELENRYLELLKKTNSVTEILAVEKQIGELRSDIESIEGRLKYLENKVSLSTLTISFYQKVSEETAFANKFADGFKNGWENLIWFLIFLINSWPFIVIGVGILFGVKLWRKRKRKK